jgi:hypothetical protein
MSQKNSEKTREITQIYSTKEENIEKYNKKKKMQKIKKNKDDYLDYWN